MTFVEPWQVGGKPLPLLHETIPLGSFRKILLEEIQHIAYPTKIFQTIEIYLRGDGQTLAFLDGIMSVILQLRRRSK